MSLITATLFLNLWFSESYGLNCCSAPLPFVAAVLGAGSLLLTALFFIGPAMAAQVTGRRVFGLIEDSLGWIPALVFRFCAVVFLALWIAKLIAPMVWALAQALGREQSPFEGFLFGMAVLLFLFATSVQNIRTNTRLALFTNKLFIAVLIAAFIRVRDGWSAIPSGVPMDGQPPGFEQLCHGLSLLAVHVAPLGLLAADFGARSAGRRQVALHGLTGIASPIFVALILSLAVGVATGDSRLYRPSLNPTLSMALFSGVAGSAMPSRMLIAAITTFGAIRFGVRALIDGLSVRPLGKSKWLLMGCFVSGIAWLSLHPFAEFLTRTSAIASTYLVIVCAVVTADSVRGRRKLEAHRFDGTGVAALLAGLSVPLCLPGRYVWGLDNWWSPWVIPSYAVAFLLCICGRVLRDARVASRL